MAYQPNLETAQELALQAYANGATVEKAMGAVGRSYRTWESWRRNYPDFARRADEIREARKRPKAESVGGGVAVPVSRNISFEDFRKEYLNQDTYRHHRAWIDVIEGRDYTPLPGETFVVGKSRKRVLINTPPFHSKSTVLTMDYATYRICMNPNVRIIIVSKTQNQVRVACLGGRVPLFVWAPHLLVVHRFTRLGERFCVWISL